MVFPRANLASQLRDIDLDFGPAPAYSVGHEQNIALHVRFKHKLGVLANLFQVWVLGPAAEGNLIAPVY